MLSGIIDGIKAIANAITTAVKFLFDFIGDLGNFISKLVKMPITVYNYVNQFFPAWIVVLIAAIIAAVIVLRIIGRD